MAAKFKHSNHSNGEVTSLSVDGEENDISKGLEAIPIRLQSTVRMMKSFQVTVFRRLFYEMHV